MVPTSREWIEWFLLRIVCVQSWTCGFWDLKNITEHGKYVLLGAIAMSRKLVYHRKNVEQMFFLPTDTWYPVINRLYSCVTWLNIISVNKKILENIFVVIDRAFLNKSVSTSHQARFFRQSIFLILIFHFGGPYTNIISVFIFFYIVWTKWNLWKWIYIAFWIYSVKHNHLQIQTFR